MGQAVSKCIPNNASVNMEPGMYAATSLVVLHSVFDVVIMA